MLRTLTAHPHALICACTGTVACCAATRTALLGRVEFDGARTSRTWRGAWKTPGNTSEPEPALGVEDLGPRTDETQQMLVDIDFPRRSSTSRCCSHLGNVEVRATNRSVPWPPQESACVTEEQRLSLLPGEEVRPSHDLTHRAFSQWVGIVASGHDL